jgi:hypothetical protein
MQKGINFFMTAYAVVILASGGLVYMFSDNPQVAPFILLGMLVLVFALPYIAHGQSGAVGNPFNGLVLGSFKHIFLVWLLGILLGGLAIGIAVGLGFTGIDPDMNNFLAFTAEQASKGGQTVTVEQMRSSKIVFEIMGAMGVLIGPFFLAAMISMSFFAVYGWLGRRLLVRGLPYTFMVLAGFGLLSSMASGLMANPMYETHNPMLALPLAAVYGVLVTAVGLWLFLVSNSAVVPALALAAFSGIMDAAKMYFADAQQYMVPPMGLSDILVLLIVAMALWMSRVPGTKHMEVAAVAFDGTSLNSAQLASLESGSSVHAVLAGDSAASAGNDDTHIAPPPPPDKEG